MRSVAVAVCRRLCIRFHISPEKVFYSARKVNESLQIKTILLFAQNSKFCGAGKDLLYLQLNIGPVLIRAKKKRGEKTY